MRKIGLAFLCLLVGLLGARTLRAQQEPIPQGLSTGQAAAAVIGQRNYSDISFCTEEFVTDEDGNLSLQCPAPTAVHLGSISGIAVAGNRLIIADSSYLSPPNNNRVLIFNDLSALQARLPQDDLIPADVVVGQPDFTTFEPGKSATKMNQPVGVATDGTRLFIADWFNNRVLIYNQIPETNGAAADVVAGQPDFDSSSFGSGAANMRRPNSVSTDGTRMMVADTLNNRVLVFNSIPAQNGASADFVLGQAGFDSFSALPTSASSLSSPMSATTDGQRLILTDLGNNRVLIYNSFPSSSGAPADVVVGQPDFSSNAPGNTATSLNFPRYAYSDGTRLLITDSGNNRILIYNQIPTQNGAAADIVLGQADFLGLMESCAVSNFAVPFAVASDGDMLFVSDSFNRRVLGFRPGPGLVAVNGVLNGASFSTRPQTAACAVVLSQPPVAPGGIAAIFGSDMADTTAAAGSFPLPTELGGVHVRFNGIEAPLFYVSPGQINVQVPFELEGFSASMEVEKSTADGSVVSAAAAVGLANGAPGIFTTSGTGEGVAVALHEDSTPVTEESPALPGEQITVFATGLGTVDHPVTNGVAQEFGASGAIQIGGTVGTGQSITITVNGLDHTYTTVEGDNLDTVTRNLADLVDANDPSVNAGADTIDFIVRLRARNFGASGTSITYSASVSEGATLSAAPETQDVVDGNVTIFGTPGPGQTITVMLQSSVFAYTTTAEDTLESIVRNLAAVVDVDPNVTALPDVPNSRVSLRLRDPSQSLNITYSARVSAGATLTALTDSQHLLPGAARARNTTFVASIGDSTALNLVPGIVSINGTPEPGQTVTVMLQETEYSYTTVAGDSLASVITNLVAVIDQDPNVSATANVAASRVELLRRTGAPDSPIGFSAVVSDGATITATTASTQLSTGTTVAISFAGLVPGTVGLYQVKFTLPTSLTANPNATLILRQNLIVLGSVTGFDIFSNVARLPIGSAP